MYSDFHIHIVLLKVLKITQNLCRLITLLLENSPSSKLSQTSQHFFKHMQMIS